MKKMRYSLLCLFLILAMLMNVSCGTAESDGSASKEEHSTTVDQQEETAPSEEEQAKEQEENKIEQEQKEKEEEARLERIAAIESMLEDPYMILVNRDHKLSSDFEPSNRVSFRGGYPLNQLCAEQLGKLVDAGKAAGYNYVLYSGYRTYSSQYNKYYNKIAYYEGQGKSHEEAVRLTDLYYAPPGASEHQTGLAADVCIPSIVNRYGELHDAYAQTPEFEWFSTHAHEYGFILRYRLGDEDITGYAYEPWHYRYVGVAAATEIYQRDITYEEYIEDLKNELAELKSAK